MNQTQLDFFFFVIFCKYIIGMSVRTTKKYSISILYTIGWCKGWGRGFEELSKRLEEKRTRRKQSLPTGNIHGTEIIIHTDTLAFTHNQQSSVIFNKIITDKIHLYKKGEVFNKHTKTFAH